MYRVLNMHDVNERIGFQGRAPRSVLAKFYTGKDLLRPKRIYDKAGLRVCSFSHYSLYPHLLQNLESAGISAPQSGHVIGGPLTVKGIP